MIFKMHLHPAGFALILFSLGLGLWLGTGSESRVPAAAVDQDAEAITKLHQKDMAASKAGDIEALRSLMTDDAVVMPPDGQTLRGRKAIDENFARMKEALSQVEVLDYELDFREVKILGPYACEWGEIRGRMRHRDGGTIESSTFKVMRILQKQPDGSWKVHRSIWNGGPTQR